MVSFNLETGFDYFGARYYSSPLGVWLSVDPMAGKYPMLSPYNYAGNSPINFRDPNGLDFDPTIDEKNKTITINATYYAVNADKKRLQQGVDAWNEQSGKYSYKVVGGDTYNINFNLTVAEGDFDNLSVAQDAFINDKSGAANIFAVIDNLKDKKDNAIRGDCDGRQIRVSADAPTRTSVHEIGHTLGLPEWSHGVMESGGISDKISKNNVRGILNTFGVGKPFSKVFNSIIILITPMAEKENLQVRIQT